MPGPTPKPSQLRQRRNKTTTAATLELEAEAPRTNVPELPPRDDGDGWHQLTERWWLDVWRSPMAPEFLQADLHGLYILARLVDGFWRDPSVALSTEIRLQRQCFGLTPIDRRRLQWEVARADELERKVKGNPPAPTRARAKGDPRLQLVK